MEDTFAPTAEDERHARASVTICNGFQRGHDSIIAFISSAFHAWQRKQYPTISECAVRNFPRFLKLHCCVFVARKSAGGIRQEA